MLVEINLLPKKDRKSKVNTLLLGLFLFIFVLIIGFFIWQINAKEAKLESVVGQIAMTTETIEIKQNQITDFKNSSSVQELGQAITWADAQRFDLVYLLDQLTAILPDRGFLMNLEMDDTYKMNQVIQFDTRSDAAYYLHTLLSFDWVDEAIVSETTTKDALDKQRTTDEMLIENDNSLIKEDHLLPRYFTQYEIIINPDSLNIEAKEAAEKAKSTGQEKEMEGDE